jgi:hypothetical protein
MIWRDRRSLDVPAYSADVANRRRCRVTMRCTRSRGAERFDYGNLFAAAR